MLYDPEYIIESLVCFMREPSRHALDAADSAPAQDWRLAGEELLAACKGDEGVVHFLVQRDVPAMLGMLAFDVKYGDADAGELTRSLAWRTLAAIADVDLGAVVGQPLLASGIHSILGQASLPDDTAVAAMHLLRLTLEDKEVHGGERPGL